MIHVLWSLKYVLTLIAFAIFAMATFLFVERGYRKRFMYQGFGWNQMDVNIGLWMMGPKGT